jgi:glycosyltransferase involved in cell wall biosynthesis
MTAMHILLIHQYFLEDHQGGGSRWNEMSRIWVNEGHQVTVVTGSIHYMQGRPSEGRKIRFSCKTNMNGVRVIRCPVSETYHSGFAGRLLGYFSFSFTSLYGALVYGRGRYDCILATSPPLHVGIAGLMLSWLKRIPFVFEVRDLWPESAVDLGVLKNPYLVGLAYWFEKQLYRNARLICVLTPTFRDNLVNKKAVKKEKIILIPNAADFHLRGRAGARTRREMRARLDLKDKFVIIYVGAHGAANHLSQILEAAELLRDTNAHFLLIGDGREKKTLIETAAARGLRNVQFMEPVSKTEVFKYIKASEVGISVLKKADIFKTVYSNKTFDYFVCGKPVLMAIDGISRELIEKAEAGLFVRPEDPVDFAQKVRFYMDNPNVLREYGENGYRFAKAHFDRDDLAKQYLQRLLDIL